MSPFPGALLAVEYHLPEQVLSNAELARQHPAWRVDQTEKKTGVSARHVAAPGETAYDLGLRACQKLLDQHPGLRERIDAVIFCTQSPDYVMPSNAFLLQRDLGLRCALLAFDFNLACSGYVHGLLMASSFMKTGIARNVLLVTADTYSRYIADTDRATRMLFGDGASASWIGEPGQCGVAPLIRSFDDFTCAADGTGWDKFSIKSGGARHPAEAASDSRARDADADADGDGVGDGDGDSKIAMNGIQIVNFVNHRVVRQIVELLAKNGLRADQIDQYLLHQGSKLALDSITKRLGVGNTRVHSNLQHLGNTVSSSIPILIKDYFSQHSLAAGSRLLLCGFGAGFSWSSLLAST